jgi:VWFA-related protein
MLWGRLQRRGALLFLVLLFAARSALADDDATPTYHSAASEVRITFFATDSANHPLNNITQDDFAVVDGEAIVRDFRSLAHSQETALDVIILIDTSESVAARLPSTVKEILHLLSRSQADVSDSISVVSFSGLQPVVLCAHDCRSSDAGPKLVSMKASGATPLFDAVEYSANLLSRHPVANIRPVVILFSDGDDTISKVSASDALRAVIDSGALLYTIDLNNSAESRGSGVLREMAETTGGRYFPPRANTLAVLQSVFEDLRASWVVTYELPDANPGFHALRILPKHNLGLRFHCRSGYYYGTNVPQNVPQDVPQ